jgi:hypothetical protein
VSVIALNTLNTERNVVIRLLVLRLREVSGSIIGRETSNHKGRFSGFLQLHRVKRPFQRISQNSPQTLPSTFLPIHHSEIFFYLILRHYIVINNSVVCGGWLDHVKMKSALWRERWTLVPKASSLPRMHSRGSMLSLSSAEAIPRS